MLISVSGYGYTGSGAVIDYLRGYTDVVVYDRIEFQMLHQADGIMDLRYFITESKDRIACNAAIKRFITLQKKGMLSRIIREKIGERFDELTEEYLKLIIQASWMGKSMFDPITEDTYSVFLPLRKIQERMEGRLKRFGILYPSYKRRYFSMMSYSEFDNITKKYIDSLLKELGCNYLANDCVLDMFVSATNPDIGNIFFENLKFIVVDRNPLDLWIVSKRHNDDYSFMPNSDVKEFVEYYKKMRNNSNISENALYIQYEDLIYKYDETTKKIRDYLGYDDKPQNEFMYFSPEISKQYTNLVLKENINEQEIEYIKSELKEYIYDFSKFSI